MTTENRWLLPEGIDELLPEQRGAAGGITAKLARSMRDLGLSLRHSAFGGIHGLVIGRARCRS